MRIECETASWVQDNYADEKTLCRKVHKSAENTVNLSIDRQIGSYREGSISGFHYEFVNA